MWMSDSLVPFCVTVPTLFLSRDIAMFVKLEPRLASSFDQDLMPRMAVKTSERLFGGVIANILGLLQRVQIPRPDSRDFAHPLSSALGTPCVERPINGQSEHSR